MHTSRFSAILITGLFITFLSHASCNGCHHSENGFDDNNIRTRSASPIDQGEARSLAEGYRNRWPNVAFTEYLLDFNAIDALTSGSNPAADAVRVYHAERDGEHVTVIWPMDAATNTDVASPARVYVGASGNICPPNCDFASCGQCSPAALRPYVAEQDFQTVITWIKAYVPAFDDPAAHGFVPDMAAIREMKSAPNCQSIRVYQGLESSGARCVVMASAYADGRGIMTAQMYKEPASELCPSNCDASKLPDRKDRNAQSDK